MDLSIRFRCKGAAHEVDGRQDSIEDLCNTTFTIGLVGKFNNGLNADVPSILQSTFEMVTHHMKVSHGWSEQSVRDWLGDYGVTAELLGH